MKLLLTSGGITNDTLANELEVIAGKQFSDLKIAFIPTAGLCDSGEKKWLVEDMYRLTSRDAQIDIVDIAQLKTYAIRKRLEWSDVIFVGGGNTFYLSYWMQEKGVYEMLPNLLDQRVYAGISAGSMIASRTIRTSSQAYNSEHFYDKTYNEFGPEGQSSDKTLGWIDFAFRPHLNSRYFPEATEGKMQDITDDIGIEMYVLDDDCAIKVDGDELSIVGGGEWHKLTPRLDK